MKVLLSLLFACTTAICCTAQGPSFQPGEYQTPDGALALTANGNHVEPYFATKALLVAGDAGLNIHDAAVKWIAWMLPRQREDGRIDRWCKKGNEWQRCGDADADDSMLAMWAELLYRTSGDDGPSVEWKQSADKALEYENGLRNRWGVYYVSHKNHTPLLMDNVEVYSAFKDIGKQVSRWDLSGAALMHARSQELATAIEHVFWDAKKGQFRSSTQKNRPGFYPDAVGQIFPWLEEMPTPHDPQENWKAWKQSYGEGWLRGKYDPHPWGLVALAALKLNDVETAHCWLQHAQLSRGGANWNILEEAAYQAVQMRRGEDTADCSKLMSGQ
jgi:hypothetical protein